MHEALRSMITDYERLIAAPVFQIPEEELDMGACRAFADGNFVRFSFVAASNRHCPFEIHFGRGTHANRFNFYIGRGGEVCAYEFAGTNRDRQELAGDVERFLRSTVRCERQVSREGDVLKEMYSPSMMMIDGKPIKFQYRGRGWSPFVDKKTIEYEPWLMQRGGVTPSR